MRFDLIDGRWRPWAGSRRCLIRVNLSVPGFLCSINPKGVCRVEERWNEEGSGRIWYAQCMFEVQRRSRVPTDAVALRSRRTAFNEMGTLRKTQDERSARRMTEIMNVHAHVLLPSTRSCETLGLRIRGGCGDRRLWADVWW